MNIMAIDPGLSGGVAFMTDRGVWAEKLPSSLSLMLALFNRLVVDYGIEHAIVEQVGSSMPGNAARASTTFARHCGHIDMVLEVVQVQVEQVKPQKWMKAMGVPSNLAKKDRKNLIKDKMAQAYPHLKVTLNTADALAILTYAVANKPSVDK